MFWVYTLLCEDNSLYTGFTDETPGWLKPYLAAALRSGITADWPHGQVFGSSEPINGTEAALLMQNALDLTVSAATDETEDVSIPSWAVTAMNAMAENGISLPTGQLTRAQAAKILYQVSRIAPNAPGMNVY